MDTQRTAPRDAERPVVVVTGASAGVGRATVRAFAARGFDVGLIARGRAGLEGAGHDVEAAGGRALAVAADVSNAADVERAADRIETDLGSTTRWSRSSPPSRRSRRRSSGAVPT